MYAQDVLKTITNIGASDLFVIVGRPVSYKLNQKILTLNDEVVKPDLSESLIREIYELAGNRSTDKLFSTGDDDFSFAIKGVSRFRASAFKQRGTFGIVIRIISFVLPNPEQMNIPDAVIGLGKIDKGLVLITGSAGSGKSTTLSCIIEAINQEQEKHIITLEDPLEYLHSHKKSIVTQREISADTESYLIALRAAMRQSPDVILLGEMRDYETIQAAMTAAETGHLIFSTLHTSTAASSIQRIIDVFPSNQQRQIITQLAEVLQAVVSQQLIPDKNGNMLPVFEIMTVTPAIRTLIRENKTFQIDAMMYSSRADNMMSTDTSLMKLVQSGKIDAATALLHAQNPEMLRRRIAQES